MDTRPIDADMISSAPSARRRWRRDEAVDKRPMTHEISGLSPNRTTVIFYWSVITRDSNQSHNHRKPDVTMHEIELLPMLHLSENWDKREKMLPLANPLSSSYSYDLAMRREYSFWFLLSYSVLFISLLNNSPCQTFAIAVRSRPFIFLHNLSWFKEIFQPPRFSLEIGIGMSTEYYKHCHIVICLYLVSTKYCWKGITFQRPNWVWVLLW